MDEGWRVVVSALAWIVLASACLVGPTALAQDLCLRVAKALAFSTASAVTVMAPLLNKRGRSSCAARRQFLAAAVVGRWHVDIDRL